MTANGQPIPFPVRYHRLRLDGDLDEFHHALNALQADTCQRGRCAPDGTATCGKHTRRHRAWREAEDIGTGGRL